MNWTRDQREAIEARGSDLLLAAAAGSGKTTVLVERVAALIQEGADIRRMLIVTFTRAAAADMRMGLIRRLNELAAGDIRFRQQAEYAEQASISTIHSFCADLLRAFFQAAGVDPAFRLAEEAEAETLRLKALEKAMNEAYAADSPDHQALTAGREPDGIREMALKAHSFLMQRPEPWEWLDERIARLEQGEDDFSPILTRAARRRVKDALAIGQYALEACMLREKLAPYLEVARSDVEYIKSLEGMEYESLRAALVQPSFARKPVVRGAKEDEDCLFYDQLRQAMKDAVEEAGKCLPVELAGARGDLPACAAELRGLKAILWGMEEEYARLKEEKSILTFADLERGALCLLRDEETARAVRERYTHVLVDEYQDVSDIQEAILARVAREGALFLVGDVKQSIYRFRHAEPTLFMEKYDAYRRGEGGRLIVLNRNFRSRPGVLEFVNSVFERAMAGEESEIVYDEAARLYPGAEYPPEDPPVEVHLIDKEGEEGEEIEGEAAALIAEMKDAEAEAFLIARRIKALLGSSVWDGKKGEYRPLTWRDFVVLTRQAKDVAQQMLAVFRREGVPAYADVSGGYLDVMEVQVALSLMRLVENRRRDPEWIAVLRAPHMGFGSEELARVRARFPQGSYWEAVAAYAELEEAEGDEIALKLKGFLLKLDKWRALEGATPLGQLVFEVLSESGLYSVVGALPGGGQRQANLDALCEKAAAYERAQSGGLTGFLAYIRDMHSAREDMGEAHVLGENDDVVRVMTVHKSKGLEFPVVFGAMLGKKLGGGRPGETAFHRRVGIGLRHVDAELATRRESLPHLAARTLNDTEAGAEEMRVLYVMLTRARDRLILVGSLPSLQKGMARWRISRENPLCPDNYLDLIMPPAMGPGGEGREGVQIRFTSRRALARAEEEAAQSGAAALEEARALPADEEMLRAYLWRYPHEDAVLLPLKLTASGLTREITGPAQPPELAPRPSFLSQEGMTGAERGTATHAALQGLDLDRLRGLSGDGLHRAVVLQLNDMREGGLLTPAMREAVAPAALAAFLEGELGARMLNSPLVRREWRFTLRMSAQEAVGAPSPEDVLVQGALDCCFLEDEAWVLLDYKTDRAPDEALIDRYRPQLELYAQALRRVTGRAVKEVWLYHLSGGRGLRLA